MPEGDLAERGIVAESIGGHARGPTQVDGDERGHLPERRGPHGLEAVGKREGCEGCSLERLVTDATQGVGERHRFDLCSQEGEVVDVRRPTRDRVGPSRVLGRRVGDQVRVIACIQHTVEALVVGVASVDLDTREFGGIREGADELVRGDLRPQVDGGQLAHVSEGVAVDGDEGARQSERLDVGVGENAAAQLCEFGGSGLIILESDLLQAGSVERFIVDAADACGDTDRTQGCVGESARINCGHTRRDVYLGVNSPVRNENAAVIHDKVARIVC